MTTLRTGYDNGRTGMVGVPYRRRYTTQERIRQTVRSVPQPKARRAFLMAAYSGIDSMITCTLTDPRAGSRGAVIKAFVRPGVLASTLVEGAPVMIQFRHGQAEVMSIG